MATRIEQILKRARIVLADKEAQRWDDDDLLLHLDEGHKDLCQHSQILHGMADVQLQLNSPYFKLPDDAWLLTRATLDGYRLPFITHSQLDAQLSSSDFTGRANLSSDWQADTGSPEAIVYDRRNTLEGRVYPIPVDPTDQANFSSPFGVTTASTTGSVMPAFGFADNLVGEASPFGLLTDLAIAPSIVCQYIKIPNDIESVTDELALPRMYDTALKYYVTAQAFLTDLNEEYQAKGAQQLSFYTRELELAMKSAQRDNQRAASSRTTYRRAI